MRRRAYLPTSHPPEETEVKAGLVRILPDLFLRTNIYAVLCTQTEVCFKNRNGALTGSHGCLPPSAHRDEGDHGPAAFQKVSLSLL